MKNRIKEVAMLSLTVLTMGMTTQAQQLDTLYKGVNYREPTFYYWGTNWVDVFNYYVGFLYFANQRGLECARYCEVDSGYHMKVIGVAAPLVFYTESNCYDTSISNREPEYFSLYKPGANETDSLEMTLLASARWDTVKPKRCMEIVKSSLNGGVPVVFEYPKVYEAYFDKPVTVTDSFYVSCSSYNNYYYANDPETGAPLPNPQPAHPWCKLYTTACRFYYGCYPPYIRIRAHRPDDHGVWPNASDSLWAYWSLTTPSAAFWLAIFPIFDTADYNEQLRAHAGTLTDSVNCDTVTGFRLLSVDDLGATFTWNGSYTGHWELSYAPYPQPADSGTIVTVTSPFRMIADVDTGVTYQAFVRQVCDDTLRSPWSSPIPFVVHREQQSIDNTPSMPSVQVWPNPASQQVTLFSSFYIRSFAVYTIDGRLIDSHTVHATTATLDVSHYPKGSYIIRTHTSYGDVTNRIVVK